MILVPFGVYFGRRRARNVEPSGSGRVIGLTVGPWLIDPRQLSVDVDIKSAVSSQREVRGYFCASLR